MASNAQRIVYSRSAVTADWKCPRSRYWGYEWEGKGLSSELTNLPLFTGTTLHDGLAAIAHGVDIDEIAAAAFEQMRSTLLEAGMEGAEEQGALTEGLLRGFYRHVWPIMNVMYPEILYIEKELTYDHDGITFMAKPDLVVRDTEGQVWYVEYKSTSSAKEEWVSSWSTAVQLHSSIKALEREINEPVAGVIVQGLFKGYKSYGKQNSPFCYIYTKPANPPFNSEQYSYEYKYGFKKQPTWERAGGVKKVVEEMPRDLLSEQFPSVPPIIVDDLIIERFFKQRAIREPEIKHAVRFIRDGTMLEAERQAKMDEVFPQYFEACSPAWGSGCKFRSLCFGNQGDPLSNGFTLRIPHHETEIAVLKEDENGEGQTD